MTENVIYRPSYDPRWLNENSESLLHICKTCSIISQGINCLLVVAVKVTNFTEKKKRRFSTLILPLGIKFRNLIAYLQYIPNNILEYHLSILSNVDRVPVTTTSSKKSFLPLIDPWGKKENSETLLRICKTCPIRSQNIIWLRLKMQTDGRTGVTTI